MTQVIENASSRMFEFKLEGDDDVYSVPLASSLPISLVRLAKTDLDGFVFALFEKYCPDFIGRDDVTTDTLKAFFELWEEANAKDGADLGKSRASSKR